MKGGGQGFQERSKGGVGGLHDVLADSSQYSLPNAHLTSVPNTKPQYGRFQQPRKKANTEL